MKNATTAGQTANELPTNLLRALALMQHKNEDFFILNGKAYEGTEDETREQYETDRQFHAEPITFSEWVCDNCMEVQELDPDDYNNDYLVLTDEEADEKWEESLDNYIEECITPEIDKLDVGNLSYYIKFDEEMWKRDARMDGRGHSLASYDGNEYEETINGQTFYIFRIN